MSSVLRYTAQRKSNFLSKGQSPNVYLFQESEILSACTAGFNQVSPTLLIANDESSLNDALSILDNKTPYEDLTLFRARVKTTESHLIDLGKTIRIGVAKGVNVDNELVVFRLIKRTGTIHSLGLPFVYVANDETTVPVPETGYIVVANKIGYPFFNALYSPVACGGV